MNKFKLLFLILPFLMSAACIENDVIIEDEPTVYFQFEYINHAWSYQHHGFIIDQQGNIYDYEQPEEWVWPEDNQISSGDFNANLAQAEVRLSSLDGNEISRIKALISQAKNGEMTEKNFVMADAGVEMYAIYTGLAHSNTLTRYLLQQRGDVYQKNKASASDEIVDWLIDIRGTEGYSDEHF